jgi:hypothetical protein
MHRPTPWRCCLSSASRTSALQYSPSLISAAVPSNANVLTTEAVKPSSAAVQRRSWHSDDSPVHPGHPRLPRQSSAFLGCAEHSEAVMPHLGCLGLLASGRDGCPLCAGTSPDTSWLPMRSTQAWADPCVHDSTGHCCLGCAERGHHWWPVQCILGCPAGPRPTRLCRTEPREAKAVLPRLRHGEAAERCPCLGQNAVAGRSPPLPCCLALRRHGVHAVPAHAHAAVTVHRRAGLRASLQPSPFRSSAARAYPDSARHS